MKAKNIFSDKLKMREFTARSIVVKELLKEVFQEKEKWQRKSKYKEFRSGENDG